MVEYLFSVPRTTNQNTSCSHTTVVRPCHHFFCPAFSQFCRMVPALPAAPPTRRRNFYAEFGGITGCLFQVRRYPPPERLSFTPEEIYVCRKEKTGSSPPAGRNIDRDNCFHAVRRSRLTWWRCSDPARGLSLKRRNRKSVTADFLLRQTPYFNLSKSAVQCSFLHLFHIIIWYVSSACRLYFSIEEATADSVNLSFGVKTHFISSLLLSRLDGHTG